MTTYCQTVNKTFHDLMGNDDRIVIIGQGTTSPWYVGGICNGLRGRFGEQRVIDTPVSESAMAGVSIGMALSGLRPILIFPRMDFMLYAFDQIINHMAKWSFMFGNGSKVPLVIWAIINRYGCQGAQHSQDLTWIFENVPGLKTVRLWDLENEEVAHVMKLAVYDDNPVVLVDNKEFYDIEIDEAFVDVDVLHPRIDDYATVGHYFFDNYPAPCSPALEEAFYGRSLY